MVQATVAVKNELGLHARAAARLVHTATRFQSTLRLERMDGSVTADAKSILNVLMLGATGGTESRTRRGSQQLSRYSNAFGTYCTH